MMAIKVQEQQEPTKKVSTVFSSPITEQFSLVTMNLKGMQVMTSRSFIKSLIHHACTEYVAGSVMGKHTINSLRIMDQNLSKPTDTFLCHSK